MFQGFIHKEKINIYLKQKKLLQFIFIEIMKTGYQKSSKRSKEGACKTLC